jgi:hypothetical protein
MWAVENRTDEIPAWPEPFETMSEAREFIRAFRARYEEQGYYLTADGLRISPKWVELEIVPVED